MAAARVVLALMMPPLKIIPVAAAVPRGAVVAFSLALITREGVLALLGHRCALGTSHLLVTRLVL